MKAPYEIRATTEKREEVNTLLNSPWGNDLWDMKDIFFQDLCTEKQSLSGQIVDFSGFNALIKDEVKYMYAYKLQRREVKLEYVIARRAALKRLAEFLNAYYPQVSSIVNIPYGKAILQWRSFLIDTGMSVNKDGRISSQRYETVFTQLHFFFTAFYDSRDEYEKDVWDCRKIPGAKITETNSAYYLDFTDIPVIFRDVAKRYIKFRTTHNSQSQCYTDIMSLRLFTKYIHEQEPDWKDLTLLTRKHMENYLCWYKGYTEGKKKSHIDCLIALRKFLDHIQRAMYSQAPELPCVCLLFDEDIPRKPQKAETDIKFIPQGVLQQLEEHLEALSPAEFIPIVILLRVSGWRISDILNLRYDTCLYQAPDGWYLYGDISKTQVLGHRVPISLEIYAVIQSVAEKVREKSTIDNNPNHLLFVRFEGKRIGRCPQAAAIQRALNRLAKKQNILDDQGNIFHFGNHAFRHTKGVELINNGMPLVYVQKWLAHVSPEMTLQYAKIFDTTLRKSWEEATKQGLFKIDTPDRIKKISLHDLENEDIIEWEYIRNNLDAVRMPLGYCMKPKKQECYTQLNPCLTCRSLCTTPDFIPQYELEIQEIKAMIERGKNQGRAIWVEKNQTLLERYEQILSVLKKDKTHHTAGKQGREYIEEERNNVK